MSFVEEMALAVEMSEADIFRIILTAPIRYKIYAIPKRDGVGMRIIAQPARELKILQRHVADQVLNRLPIHAAATAYVRGKSIRDNAAPHVASQVIMKLDFTDFFPSLRFRDLKRVFVERGVPNVAESEWPLLENILFWQPPGKRYKCLAIGAPSSPAASNVIMESLDRQFSDVCRGLDVVYTRYADDITLSGARVERLLSCEREFRRLIRETRSPKLWFNESKRGIFTMAGRRLVTGLVITPERRISLGRERKRQISAAIHQFITGRNRTIEHVGNTKGWLAYALSVEPEFVDAMVRKYGPAVRRIIQTRIPPGGRAGSE